MGPPGGCRRPRRRLRPGGARGYGAAPRPGAEGGVDPRPALPGHGPRLVRLPGCLARRSLGRSPLLGWALGVLVPPTRPGRGSGSGSAHGAHPRHRRLRGRGVQPPRGGQSRRQTHRPAASAAPATSTATTSTIPGRSISPYPSTSPKLSFSFPRLASGRLYPTPVEGGLRGSSLGGAGRRVLRDVPCWASPRDTAAGVWAPSPARGRHGSVTPYCCSMRSRSSLRRRASISCRRVSSKSSGRSSRNRCSPSRPKRLR